MFLWDRTLLEKQKLAKSASDVSPLELATINETGSEDSPSLKSQQEGNLLHQKNDFMNIHALQLEEIWKKLFLFSELKSVTEALAANERYVYTISMCLKVQCVTFNVMYVFEME